MKRQLKYHSEKLEFSEYQMDVLMDFFSDLEKLKFKNWRNQTISLNPNKHGGGRWAFGMDSYIPLINRAFSQNLNKIKYLDKILKKYNSSTVYSLSHSKEIITVSLTKLSDKFNSDKIPLIYTTSPALSDEYSKVGFFDQNDFGHVDFINALTELEKEKVLKIRELEILNLDGAKLTLRIIVVYLKPQNIVGSKTFENKVKNSTGNLAEIKNLTVIRGNARNNSRIAVNKNYAESFEIFESTSKNIKSLMNAILDKTDTLNDIVSPEICRDYLNSNSKCRIYKNAGKQIYAITKLVDFKNKYAAIKELEIVPNIKTHIMTFTKYKKALSGQKNRNRSKTT
jgi:hypothetical protein